MKYIIAFMAIAIGAGSAWLFLAGASMAVDLPMQEDAGQVEKIRKTEKEWRLQLTREQFRIMREHGTERAFTGELLKNKEAGTYLCAACDWPLFPSETKFKSGTGWPSFYRPLRNLSVGNKVDTTGGMKRTEIHCLRCEGHLGHVFKDGPKPTGLRYCINSVSLKFQKAATKTAMFGGGCFWCVEAVFERVEGVKRVESGYSGGHVVNPTYKQICGKKTGHAEVVRIKYDPARISYRELLEIFWMTHDPTTKDRQGNDVGPQYRSVIFAYSDDQKKEAEAYRSKLDKAEIWKNPIVTEIKMAPKFYPAEKYHQDYFENNPGDAYCQAVLVPKLKKFRKVFAGKLKK